jgi:hypothetical protein
MIRQREPEWVTTQAFRGLISIYVRCSYFLSSWLPQVVFTGESIVSLCVLLKVFLTSAQCFSGPLSTLLALMGVFGCLLQIVAQGFGLYTFLYGKQPSVLLVTGFVLTCAFTIMASIASLVSLYTVGNLSAGNWIMFLTLLNLVMLYYVLWQAACLLLLSSFCFEALFRLVTCRLTKPYNSEVMLPFLFYPRAPSQAMREEREGEVTRYSLGKHGAVIECLLCLIEFHSDDSIIVLNCHNTHLFHRDCLRLWKMKSNTCPMCRNPMIELREIG